MMTMMTMTTTMMMMMCGMAVLYLHVDDSVLNDDGYRADAGDEPDD